jgi:hypothetical protein
MQLDVERQSLADGVGDPGVALAVDRHTLAAVATRREDFDLAGIAGREARDRVGDGISDPYPVLLVDCQVERPIQLTRAILLPNVKIAGLLVNPTNPLAKSVVPAVQAAASSLGLELQVVYARSDEELDAAFASLPGLGVGALVIGTDPFFTSRAEKLGATSLRLAMPAIYQYREFTAAGGVMSYGGSIVDSYHHAGLYVARLLKGEKPAGAAIHESRAVFKFEERQRAWSVRTASAARARRRGDRMRKPLLRCMSLFLALLRTWRHA